MKAALQQETESYSTKHLANPPKSEFVACRLATPCRKTPGSQVILVTHDVNHSSNDHDRGSSTTKILDKPLHKHDEADLVLPTVTIRTMVPKQVAMILSRTCAATLKMTCSLKSSPSNSCTPKSQGILGRLVAATMGGGRLIL